MGGQESELKLNLIYANLWKILVFLKDQFWEHSWKVENL